MATRDCRTYGHRLRELVWRTQDTASVDHLGIPRLTLDDWQRTLPTPDVTTDTFHREANELRAEVLQLRRRVSQLLILLRFLPALIKSLRIRLDAQRLPQGKDKARILHALKRLRTILPFRIALRAIGLSASGFHAWPHASLSCELDDRSSCPRFSPQRLTANELQTVREMAFSEEYRHLPTGTLARLAECTSRAFFSPSSWYRIVLENGWRRPRKKVHPSKPRLGIRATKPNELWHVDTAIISLLDGTKVYVHAIMDNFSRRALAWRVGDRFEVASIAIPLIGAARNILTSCGKNRSLSSTSTMESRT